MTIDLSLYESYQNIEWTDPATNKSHWLVRGYLTGKSGGITDFESGHTLTISDTDSLDQIRGSKIIYLADYDATGDGSTDDTTAIQNALDAMATGYTLMAEPGKTYRISSGLTLSGVNHVTLDFAGSTLKPNDGEMTSETVLTIGLTDADIALTGETATVTADFGTISGISDTTGMAAGDLVSLSDGGSNTLLTEILTVTDSTNLAVNQTSDDSFTAITIDVYEPVKHAVVKRLGIIAHGGSGQTGLKFSYTSNCLAHQIDAYSPTGINGLKGIDITGLYCRVIDSRAVGWQSTSTQANLEGYFPGAVYL